MAPFIQFKLKGWKQVLFGLLTLAVIPLLYTWYLQRGLDAQLPALVEKQLKMDVGAEIARRYLPLDDRNASPTREQAQKYADEVKAVDRLKVLSIQKRGWGAKLVLRVTYTTAENPDAASEEVLFYRLKHNWLIGWMISQKTTRTAWQTGWL